MIVKKQKLRKKESSASSIFFYLFLGVLTAVIIGFLVNANLKIDKRREQLLAQIDYLKKNMQQLEELKVRYESELSQKETNEFWEEKLREQGYKKPGEEVAVVLQEEEAQKEEILPEKSFWQKLLETFGF